MLKALIIDDELQSREMLLSDISQHCPGVKVTSVCASGKEGILAIKKEKPDLVFLDIEMPWMNGFEMLELIDRVDFSIIFTTAHDQFAARAFRLSAIDYLLKPIDSKDLKEAVKKAEHKSQLNNNIHVDNLLKNFRRSDEDQKIALPNRDGYEFVDFKHIVYCSAEGAYTKVFLDNNTHILVSKSLGDIEELLAPEIFQRIHHSTLVNIRCVTHFIRTDGGYVKLTSGEQLPVSKSRKEEVMLKLGLKR